MRVDTLHSSSVQLRLGTGGNLIIEQQRPPLTALHKSIRLHAAAVSGARGVLCVSVCAVMVIIITVHHLLSSINSQANLIALIA